jgi:hypothetical protein
MASGITYYWNDHNTAAQTDDTLVLMIKKNGNNIGNLNTSGFAVTACNVANYGSGTADTILFPTGTSGQLAPNYAMRRYWKVTPTTTPTTAVEVIFPFLAVDSADLDGSAPGHPAPSKYKMYKIKSPINPSPALDSFRYTTAANITIYSYSVTPSTSKWSLSTAGNNYFAHMQMTDLAGGGSGFYTSLPNDVDNIATVDQDIFIYPNPTNDKWYVSIAHAKNNDLLTFQLYTADGKLAHAQTLQSGTTNVVNSSALPTGVYFYRIINNSNTFTGTLVKR